MSSSACSPSFPEGPCFLSRNIWEPNQRLDFSEYETSFVYSQAYKLFPQFNQISETIHLLDFLSAIPIRELKDLVEQTLLFYRSDSWTQEEVTALIRALVEIDPILRSDIVLQTQFFIHRPTYLTKHVIDVIRIIKYIPEFDRSHLIKEITHFLSTEINPDLRNKLFAGLTQFSQIKKIPKEVLFHTLCFINSNTYSIGEIDEVLQIIDQRIDLENFSSKFAKANELLPKYLPPKTRNALFIWIMSEELDASKQTIDLAITFLNGCNYRLEEIFEALRIIATLKYVSEGNQIYETIEFLPKELPPKIRNVFLLELTAPLEKQKIPRDRIYQTIAFINPSTYTVEDILEILSVIHGLPWDRAFIIHDLITILPKELPPRIRNVLFKRIASLPIPQRKAFMNNGIIPQLLSFIDFSSYSNDEVIHAFKILSEIPQPLRESTLKQIDTFVPKALWPDIRNCILEEFSTLSEPVKFHFIEKIKSFLLNNNQLEKNFIKFYITKIRFTFKNHN